MSHISSVSMIVSGVVLSATLGCSSQPMAPSSLDSPSIAGVAAGASSASSPQGGTSSTARFGKRETGVIYVTSQGLYYDTFVVKDPLPMHGRFQLLSSGETEFGPGQPGYLGGRWWEDLNGNGMQDADDHFFLCPLLPPGRTSP